jgi:Domain of unknown function (DUF4331)
MRTAWGFASACTRTETRLDFTDLYAFPKPGEADKSILIMNVHPSDSARETPQRKS